ncbi:MAG: ATP-binding cassette domain-containing protein [Thermosphaera sp.]
MFYILSTRMMPPITLIIPIFIMYYTLGLKGTYVGLILVYGMMALPLSVWMTKSFIDDIPKDIDDAAVLDGHSTMYILFKIVLPMVVPGIAASAAFAAITIWNEFLFALLLSGIDTKPTSVLLSNIGGKRLQLGKSSGDRSNIHSPDHNSSILASKTHVAGIDFWDCEEVISLEKSIMVTNIFKEIRRKKILDGVSFEAKKGELIFILGPPGSGKTTLLKIIAGLEKQDAGSVFINGVKVDELPPYERKISMVFETLALYSNMTVFANIACP